MIELGVNIDHVATVRQARKTYEPDPVWAAVEAHLGGADGITVHLREDRRHIQDVDVRRLRELTHIKLNLEMAATDEMIGIAVASATPFSRAVSAPPRLPRATIWTSPTFKPAFSITSTPIISPSDFGLLIANFLPFRSAGVLSAELGMTIRTRSASDRDVMPMILTPCPCAAAAITGAAVTSP